MSVESGERLRMSGDHSTQPQQTLLHDEVQSLCARAPDARVSKEGWPVEATQAQQVRAAQANASAHDHLRREEVLMTNKRLEQIRLAHQSARPNAAENPAWANCHADCGVLLAEIERLQAMMLSGGTEGNQFPKDARSAWRERSCSASEEHFWNTSSVARSISALPAGSEGAASVREVLAERVDTVQERRRSW